MCMRVEERDILIHNSSFLILNLENAREIDIKKIQWVGGLTQRKAGGWVKEFCWGCLSCDRTLLHRK